MKTWWPTLQVPSRKASLSAGLCVLAASFIFFACDSGHSAGSNLIPSTDDMMCEQHAQATVVDAKTSRTSNPCDASAKVQAIAYECGVPTETSAFTHEAFVMEVERAREKCQDFCKDQDSSCEGNFQSPGDCGLKSPAVMSSDFGKNVIKCPKSCKGQAFNYCSIYHSAFFSVGDKSLFTSSPENCRCYRK